MAAIAPLLSLAVPPVQGRSRSHPTPVNRKAAEVVAGLLGRANPEELTRLDKDLRARSPYLSAWGALGLEAGNAGSQREETLDLFEGHGAASVALVALVTCHPSGWLREAALLRLEALARQDRDQDLLLPCLLLRVNDWVAPIRELARELLAELVNLERAPALLRHVALLGPGEEFRAIHELLASPETRSLRERGLGHPLREVRRYCWHLLEEEGGLGDLLLLVLRDPDPLLRFAAARRACGEPELNRLSRYLERLRRDPSGRLRAEALQVAAERFPTRAREFQEEALLDRDLRVREVGRFLARRAGDPVVDFRAFYLARLDPERGEAGAESVAPEPGALLGLSDVGLPQDAPIGGRLLGHADPRVRRAAVQLVGRLAPERYLEDLVEALADEQGGVSRSARQVLAPLAASLDPESLWALCPADHQLHARKNALHLLARASKWTALRFLLPASLDPALGALATRELERWFRTFNRRQAPLAPSEREALVASLDQNRDRLPQGTVRSVERILGIRTEEAHGTRSLLDGFRARGRG